MRVHGTAIALLPPGPPLADRTVTGKAVLIRGESGAGKSDLALRCIGLAPCAAIPWQATLVCDDQVQLTAQSSGLYVGAIDSIFGKLEVRGVGLIAVGAVRTAPLALIVDLTGRRELIERLPEDERINIEGYAVRRISLYPFDASASHKLLLALTSSPLPQRCAA